VPIPIVLGVTGHRLLAVEDRPKLQKCFAAILDRFAQDYPGTPLVLLSSLAPGADQLAAEVALAKGCRVLAPLPFPADVYLASTSFQPKEADDERTRKYLEEARSKLTEMLQDRDRVEAFVAPFSGMPADPAAWQALSQDADERRHCYANAGGSVVLHSHALIALWDGLAPTKAAGTSEMVAFKLSGRPPEAYHWDKPLFPWADRGPVFVVHTPRDGQAGGRPLGEEYPLYPGDDPTTPTSPAQERRRQGEARRFQEICREIHAFNQDQKNLGTPREDMAVLKGLLRGDPAALPIQAGLLEVAHVRDAAAVMARRRSTEVHWLLRIAFILIFLAVLFFQFYAHLFTLEHGRDVHQPAFLATFVVLLIIAVGIVVWVRRGGVERKALDYRALAEALRVQFYWGAAGVGESVVTHYLEQVRSELSWLRRAVRACQPLPADCRRFFAGLPPQQQRDLMEAVGKGWLQGQESYYQSEYRRYRRVNRTCRWGGLALAVLGWAVAVLLLLTGPGPSLIVLSGVLVVAGGLLIAYSERRLCEELAHQFKHMHDVFAHGREAFQQVLNDSRISPDQQIEQAQRLLRELGREALSENAQWLILRRTRPFDVVVH
jgi:hypothetical protein